MRLGDLARGRDNNLNLLRVLAALGVLFAHSFVLSTGHTEDQPLWTSFAMTPGSIAVDIFFVASGFLVTRSLDNKQSASDFIWSRVLRIFPGLLVVLLLTVFVLGAGITQRSLSDYFADSAVRKYLLQGFTLIRGVPQELPGVFEANPFPRAVNGSLWTLPVEVRMYALLLLVWWLLRRLLPTRALFAPAVFALAAGAWTFMVLGHFGALQPGNAQLMFMFFAGASAHFLRRLIELDRRVFWVALLSLFLSGLQRDAFFIVYGLTLPYLVLFVAYAPGGRCRQYNRVGDYSYGIYIYAFPVQQSVAALLPGVSILSMMLLSTAVTVPLAAASWHFVESRALRLKRARPLRLSAPEGTEATQKE